MNSSNVCQGAIFYIGTSRTSKHHHQQLLQQNHYNFVQKTTVKKRLHPQRLFMWNTRAFSTPDRPYQGCLMRIKVKLHCKALQYCISENFFIIEKVHVQKS